MIEVQINEKKYKGIAKLLIATPVMFISLVVMAFAGLLIVSPILAIILALILILK